MEDNLILIDSSVFIDFYRKTKKENTFLSKIINSDYLMAISVITQFEILVGSKKENQDFWNELFENVIIFSIDASVIEIALKTNNQLKSKNKQIAFPDLLISSTAIYHKIPLATLNVKHFNRIDDLTLIKF